MLTVAVIAVVPPCRLPRGWGPCLRCPAHAVRATNTSSRLGWPTCNCCAMTPLAASVEAMALTMSPAPVTDTTSPCRVRPATSGRSSSKRSSKGAEGRKLAQHSPPRLAVSVPGCRLPLPVQR